MVNRYPGPIAAPFQPKKQPTALEAELVQALGLACSIMTERQLKKFLKLWPRHFALAQRMRP